jgi:hypothetical protein
MKLDINHVKRSITSNEIEIIIFSPTKKSPGSNRFTAEFYQTFKKEQTLSIPQTVP